MATRFLYLARHGHADPFGELTDVGREQARLLGSRLAHLPVDAVWHSPLPRAATSAQEIAARLGPGVEVAEAPELVDHVPDVPADDEMPPAWRPFFDGFDAAEAAAGRQVSRSLTRRFAVGTAGPGDAHEVLVTHAYPIAWLVRDALGSPTQRWLGLESANTALTVIEHRPGQPAGLVMFNDQSHLPAALRWTGFPRAPRP
ncbi:histidine phosphatase family protein [Isoptericola halotolerans]|uniref:Phosphoglycerate mutase n=1 Tax=Isoptericola halotolerans TaxID=300560 RepID=A0ABX2AAF5_9MICO|nr:histidine phosphatase family protein [Isoptericola halotolerans]NOV98941.1 putative phosphoglycerate mutase [Isoptericola halotolerans]